MCVCVCVCVCVCGGLRVGMARLVDGKVPGGVVVDPPRAAAAVGAPGAGRLGEAVGAEIIGAALAEGDGGDLGVGGLALAVGVGRLAEERYGRVRGEAGEEEEGCQHGCTGVGVAAAGRKKV